ncbi:MAG: asparagine synthase C-terminal domain-containing protein [Methanomassiliicoccaceae archaeon]|nr:asparagine synthase C-terminal domain-containing protein [Methanomassiliicoccaceae archaeon]
MSTADLTNELLTSLDASVKETAAGNKIAVAFSGGLDSGIIAALSNKYADVTLYTVGMENAYDVKTAEEMAKIMKIRWNHIEINENNLEKELSNMICITGTVNPITLSFEVPLYFVLKHSDENIVLSGQGADELFAGFSKYVGMSEERFSDTSTNDMAQLMNITLAHERAVASHFGKMAVYPYLNERVVDVVNRMSICGVSEGEIRKPLLRDVAKAIGQPELAEKPKKAAQYGSGTMVALRSMAKKRKMTVREMIADMASSIGNNS